ncbi:MAG: DUF937 domain-containing protein [Rhodothermales bacterium]
MSGLLDLLAGQLGGGTTQQISQQLGANPQQVQTAMQAAIPALVGALAKNAQSPQGAQSLASALERDHDGSVLDNIGGLLGALSGGSAAQSGGGGLGGMLGGLSSMMAGNTATGQSSGGSLLDMAASMFGNSVSNRTVNGGGILGHILGGQQPAVEREISQASGLDMGKVAQLLPMLAPLVMGALGKMKQQQNLSPNDLQDVLQRERATAAQSMPQGAGGLMGMLDLDGDGNAMNDIGNIAGTLGKLFGR